MSKKIISAVSLTIIVLFFATSCSNGIKHFDAYESSETIYLNDTEVIFELPIVTIDGQTYIPLNEATEKANAKIELNEEEQKIMLYKKTEDLYIKEIFGVFFGFPLPDTVEIIGYDSFFDMFEGQVAYGQLFEQFFFGKFSFNKEDLNLFKNYFETLKWKEIGAENAGVSTYFTENYTWWDLPALDEAICIYYKSTAANTIRRVVDIQVFITESQDNRYNLYVART